MSITSGFTISKAAMDSSKRMKTGVYVLNIKEITQGPGTKDPTSTTTTINFEVKDGEYQGLPLKFWLSEKMPANAVEFFEAVTGTKLPDTGVTIGAEQILSLEGRDVKAAVKNIKDEKFGYQNKIEGFLPL